MSESKFHLDVDDSYYADDDKHTITVTSRSDENSESNTYKGGNSPLASPLLKGMGLNFAACSKEPYRSENSEGIQEESVNIVFDLPDGSQGENTFKLGHTVEVLKSFIETEYGILMADQKLYLDDRLMLNPLSLLDYPQAKGGDEMFVRVEGNLPKNSKK